MFGSKKIQELEARVRELTESLGKQQSENASLTQQLETARSRISEMEAQLNDFDLAQAVEEAKASRAEFEGLKELYTRKNREFDDFKEEEEQRFARDQALQRHNLENEIRDNRQANQDYVTSTVKTFGESYNYYLNQIKVLMDALGSVATRTGEALFSGGNADLRASFGHQMRDLLKSGVDAYGDDGVVVEAEDVPEAVGEAREVAEYPAAPEAAEPAVEACADADQEADGDAEAPREPLEEEIGVFDDEADVM